MPLDVAVEREVAGERLGRFVAGAGQRLDRPIHHGQHRGPGRRPAGGEDRDQPGVLAVHRPLVPGELFERGAGVRRSRALGHATADDVLGHRGEQVGSVTNDAVEGVRGYSGAFGEVAHGDGAEARGVGSRDREVHQSVAHGRAGRLGLVGEAAVWCRRTVVAAAPVRPRLARTRAVPPGSAPPPLGRQRTAAFGTRHSRSVSSHRFV
jgi:hypothetical protein